MKLKVLSYLIFALLIPALGFAQVDTTKTDSVATQSKPDSLMQTTPDTVITARPDTLKSDSVVVLFKVRPWKYHTPLLGDTVATDSTLRWQVWPSWTSKKNRDPGVITYRLGTIGRTNSMQIDAHEPKYLQLYWEDLRMNDPVSGILNWNYIPHHKIESIYESDLGTVYRTKFYLKDYYLNQPLTQLNYTESTYDTRSLEFVVSHNLSQKTNAEISYWDRRDGGEYDRSEISGRQIYARVTHQLDGRQLLKLRFLNNNYDNQLPFGYNLPVSSGGIYIFDPYNTSANEFSAKGDRSSTIFALDYYRRPADTTQTTSNFQAGIFSNSAKRNVTYSADTTAYKVQDLGANVRKWFQAGPVRLEGAVSADYFLNKDRGNSSLDTGNWAMLSSEAKAAFEPLPLFEITGHANYRYRSDDFSDYRLGATGDLMLGNKVKLSAAITTGAFMPTPQQLYWQAEEFHGDINLTREKIQTLLGKLNISPFKGSELGLKSELKQIKDGIRIGDDSTFTNSNPYSSFSNAVFFNYNSTHFEFSSSASIQQFGSFLQSRPASFPVDETQRIWFKAGAYAKGYLFNRATYVKAGLSGVLSPQSYASAHYYPSLDFWQPSQDDFIPSFNRLDVDLSARIRSIMIVLRYENVLDDVVQQGYFETDNYPMPGRRFVFGIRVLFRN